MNAILSIFDSTAFQIFFAAWTGFYLWQIISGEEGRQSLLFSWAAIGFLAAMLVIGNNVKEG